jgi:hypothetical protein
VRGRGAMSDLERRSNRELDRGGRSHREATLDSYACGDCHRPPNLFMVHDDLWVWHIPGPDLLCLACAQRRLGRAFVAEDFKAGPGMNAWIFEAFERGEDPTCSELAWIGGGGRFRIGKEE